MGKPNIRRYHHHLLVLPQLPQLRFVFYVYYDYGRIIIDSSRCQPCICRSECSLRLLRLPVLHSCLQKCVRDIRLQALQYLPKKRSSPLWLSAAENYNRAHHL